MTTHKQCSKCKARKPVDEFHKNGKDNHGKTRYRSTCKPCEVERDKKKYQKKVTKRIASGERVKIPCKTVLEKQQPSFTLSCRKRGAWSMHHSGEEHPAYKHGYCKDPLYGTWIHMIQRCHNPDNPSYEHYGERGITVCLRWRESFEAFIKDMGEKPKESWSLDRVDNDKGYSPQNTRWASPKHQATNNRAQRYLEYKSER
ncbi:hypothetical protein [Photobacterium sanguinicancri]|uniref:HNH endonuclease n=1 Tax=Photobacterium sanguinicancri TaxID=875932 RepID=A0AAW7Y976_9GAMM|nr:hypothetical protein [Photobacterium sanguinicancri]MDO6544286.1 hypothetical protein [Photobacterium sanguinicancri]